MSSSKILARGRELTAGLDVDRRGAVVELLDVHNGEVVYESRVAHDAGSWHALLGRLPDCRIHAFYEACGTGFGLCRRLNAMGVDCRVAAPSQVPKGANLKQTKTDQRDARTLAQLYFHPPRTFVRVPTEREEARRQLSRLREQLLSDKQRVMRRIRALLQTYELTPPAKETGRPWSRAYRQWLRDCDPGYEELRFTLDVMLDHLEATEQQLDRVDRQLRELSRDTDYREACDRLTQIAGVGTLSAMTFLLEIFRPADFATANELAAHVGFTPGEYSSGGRQRRGHITHWGSPALRRLLVEAAWVWVARDAQACQRFHTIRAGKSPKLAIVGMARRLAIALWAMTVKRQDYSYHWTN